MNRRIFRVILLVTTFAVIAFGIPLAVVARELSYDQAADRLEREAARASQEVPRRALTGDASIDLPRSDNTNFAVYDTNARLVTGVGPNVGDGVVQAALQGSTRNTRHNGRLIAALPITRNQQVFAVMRASQSLGPTRASVLHKWLLMGGLAAAVLLIATGAAVYEARRLSRPVDALAVAVTRLGDGDFTVRAESSGVPEIDQAGNAVNATADRLGRMIERERAFSGDASHQLRTPLTGLRLHLENALADPTGDHTEALNDALGAVERLEATVVDLLALARGATPAAEPIDVGVVVAQRVEPWQPLVTSAGRTLKFERGDDLPEARVAPGAVCQIVDVLVSNALVHGAGVITVRVHDATGAVAIDVADEGPGVNGDVDRIFVRGEGTHHGIGLSLARSLAEAEKGRLILRHPGPHPCFTLLLPGDEPA